MTPLDNIRSALSGVKFSTTEKLKSKKEIQELFDKGSSFYIYPIRVKCIFGQSDSSDLPKIVIAVPKKFFKRAHDRNLLKRRIREAYRLNKSILLKATFLPNSIGFIYTSNEEFSFPDLEKKLILILQRLVEEANTAKHEKIDK